MEVRGGRGVCWAGVEGLSRHLPSLQVWACCLHTYSGSSRGPTVSLRQAASLRSRSGA